LAAFKRPARGLVWFALGVVVMLLAVSFQSLLSRQDDELEPGEIVVLTGADDSVGGQRQQLIKEWNDDHPDNPARLESLSSEADRQHSEMVARAQSGTSGVDVYNLDVTWVAEFAAARFIQPLDDSVSTEGFLAKPLATCRFEDKLWALPFNTDAALLYYRTDLVPDAEGLPSRLPPSEAEMRALATAGGGKLKAGYVGQLGHYEGLTVNALEVIWANGGDVVDADGRVVIDSEAAREGLRQLAQGMASAGSLPPAVLPTSRSFIEKNSTDAFRAGDVALMRNWPVAYGQLRGGGQDKAAANFDISNKFGVTRLPGGPSVLGGQNLAISSGTTRPRAARELIEFLTSEGSQRRLFGDGGLPATRAAAYNDPTVREARPYADALLDAVSNARPRPLTTHYALFTSVFQEVVFEALTPGRTAEEQGRLPDNAVSRLTDALQGRLR